MKEQYKKAIMEMLDEMSLDFLIKVYSFAKGLLSVTDGGTKE